MRLTKEVITRAQPPEPGKKERFIRDNEVRGLGVRITAQGTKNFIFEARMNGRPRRLTIGSWPDINVVVARQRALEIRAKIAHGHDPIAPRKETTFQELGELYLERHARPPKTQRDTG
jgi:hypothetical protein